MCELPNAIDPQIIALSGAGEENECATEI